jgi:hypothetical protein
MGAEWRQEFPSAVKSGHLEERRLDRSGEANMGRGAPLMGRSVTSMPLMGV